jgi:hypothetical protein
MSIAIAATMTSPARVLRLALLGAADEPLRQLLEDALRDGRIRCEFVWAPASSADAAVVMVTWGEEAHLIAAARAQAVGVPLLAILPFGDDRLAECVLRCGAQDWYALDSPLENLRARLVALAARDTLAAGAAA